VQLPLLLHDAPCMQLVRLLLHNNLVTGKITACLILAVVTTPLRSNPLNTHTWGASQLTAMHGGNSNCCSTWQWW
jgi:hypothetical protein